MSAEERERPAVDVAAVDRGARAADRRVRRSRVRRVLRRRRLVGRARALRPRARGLDVVAVTAVSPSYPAGELEVAATVAADVGRRPSRRADARGRARGLRAQRRMRCYHCKAELYATLSRVVGDRRRPGRPSSPARTPTTSRTSARGCGPASARASGTRCSTSGSGRRRVRAIARALGLRVADKPALACLSSRVELGIRVTPELLERIDRAERGRAGARVRRRSRPAPGRDGDDRGRARRRRAPRVASRPLRSPPGDRRARLAPGRGRPRRLPAGRRERPAFGAGSGEPSGTDP